MATLRRAAEAARRLGGLATAARLLERALDEPPPPELVDAIDFERGRALLDAGAQDGATVLARVVHREAALPARALAARHLARHLALDGRSEEAAVLLGGALEGLDDSQRELRLELLAELAFIAGSVRGGRGAAMRTIAAEAARVTMRTPAERLLVVAAHVWPARRRPIRRGPRARCSALRLHRDFPGGYAVGDLTSRRRCC